MFRRIAILLCAAGTICSAADWSSLYPASKLEAEQSRLHTAINFLIQTEIQPFIPPQDATAFGLQEIDFPVNGFRSDPLDFYAENKHIILPVRTLLFVEDLARAYGWMWANRLETGTVDEYLNMLHYRSAADFPDGRYPAPLEALHVPGDALSDPHVVEASVRLRRSACAFMLLHQFAHLHLHHDASANHGFSEAQEEAADLYALNIMKENSATPTGIFLMLYSSLYLEAGDGNSLHPVTPQRLTATAHFLELHILEFVHGRNDQDAARDAIHSISKLFQEGSEWLQVRGHQEELQQLAMKTNPSTLQPKPLPRSTK